VKYKISQNKNRWKSAFKCIRRLWRINYSTGNICRIVRNGRSSLLFNWSVQPNCPV